MAGEHRLERLRELVGRLEQLPGSEERDRVLREVRARAVDLDTGETPRAMLPVEPPGGAAVQDRPAADLAPRPAPVKVERVASAKACPPPPQTWSLSILRAPAPVTDSIDLLAAGEQLCLEESPGSHPHRPWVRGLRG